MQGISTLIKASSFSQLRGKHMPALSLSSSTSVPLKLLPASFSCFGYRKVWKIKRKKIIYSNFYILKLTLSLDYLFIQSVTQFYILCILVKIIQNKLGLIFLQFS